MSKLTRAIEELARRADAGDNASLMFLHNTSAAKLQRVQDMGGMPMPSIAITDKDIPFENFGDITLVGKPESFDPKSSSLNQAFSADAYTVRAPRPVRIAKKGAGKRFQELYGADAKELDVYAADTAANVWDLEKKGDVREDKYDQVVRWFDDRSGPIFLKDKGIPFNKESRQDIDEKLQPFRQSGEFKQWAEGAVDDLFEEGEYFIANPNRDYYTQKAKLMPYTADEIAKVMKRSAGRGGEGGMSTGSPGAVRAAYSEKLTSLDAMRKRKDQLSGDIGIKKEEIENLLIDLGDALKPYYKYDPNGWSYRDAVSELMTEGATRGLKRSADFVGFENIPQDLMSELEGFQQILKKAPTEYFESKPKRVVQLNEFGGAIVPEGTSQSTIDLLTRQGLEIEQYADDAQRLEARKKFKKLLFQLPPVAATAVISGIAAVSAPDAQAGPLKSGTDAVTELAKRAAQGDVKAAEGIRAYHGTPYSFDRFSTDQIGTGEGNQSYGRGLYFAEREGTAQSYRDALSTTGYKASSGKKLTDMPSSYGFASLMNQMRRNGSSNEDVVKMLRREADKDDTSPFPEAKKRARAARKLADKVEQGDIVYKSDGSMYEVNIAATPDEFIDWDLPLDEQSESVMNALKKTGWYKYAEEGATNAAERRGDNAYGMDLVRWLEEDGAEDAAQLLKDAGIKGVQYADAQTRFGKGAKTKNYVVYDDKLIDITRKYGISVPLASAVAAGTMTPEEAQAGPISSGIKRLASAYDKVANPQAEGVARMVEQGQISPEQAEKYTNTIKAYKLFRTKGGNTDELFPLFVNANKPVRMGEWNPAESGSLTDAGKVKSSIGPLAYRPGWHAGDAPVATHIGGKSDASLKAPDYRPADQVWAEVEMPADVDWQSVADSRMEYSKAGKPIPRTAQITDQIPEGGYYRYKTNPNMTGDWLIAGDMKVNRVLTPSEVYQINAERGVHDLPPVDENGKMLWSLALGSGLTAAGIAPEEAKAELLSEVPQEQAQQLQDNWSQIEANAQAGMGGMGVRSASTAEDEEAMLAAQPPAPTGGDLLRQANDEFMGGIMTEPRSYMGDIEQALLGGIMQTAGMADLAADVFSSLAAPVMSAPGAIGRYVADRYIPGVNYSAEDIARERKATEDYFNYQPRTDLGPQYGEQAAQTIGGVIGPYLPAIKKAADDSYILGAMRKGYDYLGEKEKELAKAMLDLSPI